MFYESIINPDREKRLEYQLREDLWELGKSITRQRNRKRQLINHDGLGFLSIVIYVKECKVIDMRSEWYHSTWNYCGGDYDWVDMIDFDTSLDSFYQYQYYKVLNQLDSLTLTIHPRY